MHRGQCSNEDLLSTFVDGRAPNTDIVAQHRHLMEGAAWKKWLEIVYGTLRSKGGEFAGPEEYGVYWIGIRAPTGSAANTVVPVAYVWLGVEPHQLYMHVYDVVADKEWGRPGEEPRAKQSVLLDDSCVVFDLDPDRKPASLFYPIGLSVPTEDELRDMTVVDWELRPRSA
jgi:hypothetical protein